MKTCSRKSSFLSTSVVTFILHYLLWHFLCTGLYANKIDSQIVLRFFQKVAYDIYVDVALILIMVFEVNKSEFDHIYERTDRFVRCVCHESLWNCQEYQGRFRTLIIEATAMLSESCIFYSMALWTFLGLYVPGEFFQNRKPIDSWYKTNPISRGLRNWHIVPGVPKKSIQLWSTLAMRN